MMATFVPDELIYESDLSRKSFRKFNAVLALINMTRLFNICEKYISAENGGSHALFNLLNNYTDVMIEEVYISHGDVLKFSQDSLLVMWKVNRDEFFSKTIYNVILCVQRIQEAVSSLKSDIPITKVDVAVSAGEVIFSVIGDENGRDFVIAGGPVDNLKFTRRICLPGDLVLSSSAWNHCAPNQYEYVLKDSKNVKIIKVLAPPDDFQKRSLSLNGDNSSMQRQVSSIIYDLSEQSVPSDVTVDSDGYTPHVKTRVSLLDALRRRIGRHLRTYMVKPVLAQIAKEEPLSYLTEMRQITMVSISIIPNKCSTYELISLVDQLYKSIRNVVEKYYGCIGTLSLYESDITIYILYGIRGYDDGRCGNNSRNGLLSATEIIKETKRTAGVATVLMGITTGIAFCGVVGHSVRSQYVAFGTPTSKAISLTMTSFDKISCDYDTLLESNMCKEKFRPRGIKVLKRFGKCHVYEYMDTYEKPDTVSNIEYSYPILGRYQEIEYFKDILDDIGVPGRIYSGLLIEGAERAGKSRILDALVSIVRNRQIKLVQLALHPSYSEKAYALLYHLFLQIFNAEECTTIRDRERVLLDKLANFVDANNFCYLNTIMRVQFPLSDEYCDDADWKRHMRTIEIFEQILTEVAGNMCVLLDDVQYIDTLSWQFLSSALNNVNIVLVATMQEPASWENMTQVEAAICQDKRLMNRTLQGLDRKHLAAFACQFLNVYAIPKELEKILVNRSKNVIGWCEAFLMSALQVEALKIVAIAPREVSRHNLVFPNISFLAKIPSYLTPEELAPPMHWKQLSTFDVCLLSDKSSGIVDYNRDVTGLRIDMYNRMNAYQQDFVKCAAALGDIFLRDMVDSVMPNSTPVYTAKAVAELIKLRILECAMIQRRHFYADETLKYMPKKRRTFSNMHHVLGCDCQSSRTLRKLLPLYAHCKVLEFTMSSYRKLFYEILSQQERNDYHLKAANIYEKHARRCDTCGGGKFLSILNIEDLTASNNEMLEGLNLMMENRETIRSQAENLESRRSIFVGESDTDKKGETVRRISILPFHVDFDGSHFSDTSSETGKEARQLFIGGKNAKQSIFGFRTKHEISWDDRLKDLSYVDFRNCRCIETIDYTFWKLHNHLANSKEVKRLMEFTLEYGAGLIETGQPLYATKYLAAMTANIDSIEIERKILIHTPETIVDKGRSLVLMGDAYTAFGNYPAAKKLYTEAVALRYDLPQSAKAICYNTILQKMRYKVRGIPKSSVNRSTGTMAAMKLELAVYFHRLSVISMLHNDAKMAELSILQSLRAAFESAGAFLEQGRIYLTAVEIFQQIQQLSMIQPLEKPMLFIIEQRTNWKNPQDVVAVAEVYQTIYESRILHGKLEQGIEIGINICKICNPMHLNKVKLAVLPSLIEIMVWTKHLNEAVDLLHELYYLSSGDVDYSSITWYYALCMELLLDASMVFESFEDCHRFYIDIVAFKYTRVLRDPESVLRLGSCIVIWQLRRNSVISGTLVKDAAEYVENVTCNKFSQLYNSIKGLECYLLILQRRINIKKSTDLLDRVQNVTLIMKFLQDTSSHAPFVKPFLHLLASYMELLRGRKATSQTELQKSQKHALSQGNKLVTAWCEQNRRTWEEGSYNNMAMYWVEHVSVGNAVQWQEIHSLSSNAWSTILYPLPVPDNNF